MTLKDVDKDHLAELALTVRKAGVLSVRIREGGLEMRLAPWVPEPEKAPVYTWPDGTTNDVADEGFSDEDLFHST